MRGVGDLAAGEGGGAVADLGGDVFGEIFRGYDQGRALAGGHCSK